MNKKKKGQQNEEVKQLDLDIKEPYKNKFYKLKRDFDTTVLQLEVIKFLKDPLVWAMFVISAILIYFQIQTILENIQTLPTYLPILRFYTSPTKQLIETKYLYAFPVLSASLLVVSTFFISKNYNREKNLVKLLLVSTLILVIFLTIALINLVSI